MKSARDVKASVGIVGVFFRLLLIAAAALFATRVEAAKTFKGVLDTEGTITFYYDDVDHSAEGTVRTHTAGSTGYPPWKNDTAIQNAVFTPSCASFAWTKGLQYFFCGCSSLETVEGLQYVNTSSATSFYQMFKDCSSLVELDLGFIKAPVLDNVGDMFYGCSLLETLDISGLTSASITGCDNTFRACPALTTIYVRDGFDMTSISNTGNKRWMFTGDSSLVGGNGTKQSKAGVTGTSYARIDNPPDNPGYFTLKTQTLTIATSEFAEKHIVSVAVTLASDGSAVEPDEPGGSVWTFPRWTAVNITYTAAGGYEFAGEETFTDATFATDGIPSDETLEGAEIPTAAAFTRCSLTIDTSVFESLRITSFSVCDASGATLVPESGGSYSLLPGAGFTITYRAIAGYAFGHYVSATNDTTWATTGISADMVVTPTSKATVSLAATQIKGVVFDTDPTTMTFYCDNVAYEGGVVYARRAATGGTTWVNATNILRVIVDPSMKNYGRTGDGFQYLFQGFSSATNIEGLANLDTSAANNFTQMFKDCRSLVELDLSKLRTPNVKNFGDMFFGCQSLVTIDISKFSSASVEGCGGMFRNCGNLRTIYASANFDLKNAKSDSWMFSGASGVVGGYGTTVVGGEHQKQYAHVDVPGNPGYFTLKPQAGLCVILR